MIKSKHCPKFRRKIICLMGPTASGKTDTAIYLSQHFPSELISVDSTLIYQDMDIGTAKPSKEILEQFPHHLINIISPTERYNAAQFRDEAIELIEQAFLKHRIPILVGGTFLYFKTLLNGISNIPESDKGIQEQLSVRAKEEGTFSLHQELVKIDPISAQRINQNDTQRIVRALEVYLATGKTLSAFWAEQQQEKFKDPFLKIALLPQSIENSNLKIEKRFESMLNQGLIDEVIGLKKKYPTLTSESVSQRAVGYRQVWDYLAGVYDKETLREKAIIATRQYAKRQRTWLKSETDLHTIITEENFENVVLNLVDSFL